MRPRPSSWARPALGLATTLALLVLIPSAGSDLERCGYGGTFLVGLLGSAGLLIGTGSYHLALIALGATLQPLAIGLLAGTGMALGEITGWLVGYGGQVVLPQDQPLYRWLRASMARHGAWTIFFLALVPSPLIDVGGMIARATRMPAWKFVLAAWLGKTLRALLLAYTGLWGQAHVLAAMEWLSGLLAP